MKRLKTWPYFLQLSMELEKNHGFESLSHGSVFNSSIESKILSHLHVNNSTGTCTPKATKKACGYNFFPTS